MEEAKKEPRWSRRHLWREIGDLVRVPISMFEGKHREPRAPLRFSMFRVILALFAWDFHRNFPTTWTSDDWTALALILFALPLSDLFARVPVSEAVGALEAFFGHVTAKSAAGAARRFVAGGGAGPPTELPDQGEVPSPEDK